MITSVKNETIKQWNKLKKKKYREEAQQFLIEGMHLVEEAMKSDWSIEAIIVQENIGIPFDTGNVTIVNVSNNVMDHLADTKAPQGIMAVVNQKEVQRSSNHRLLLLDSIQDPGNVGTMIRTADAAGFSGVILGENTVDLFNDKVIRSTQGSIFHLPIIQANLAETCETLKKEAVSIWASTLEQADAINELTVPDKVALIVGNEGAGVSPALLQQADQRVHIPIYGQAESLNVSVAAGIMIYQMVL
ncbi:Putative TrmH family tRNA/rRNA methyltransferase [Paraliobacillus sp. PM-2]|uniref:TrmH family RNA methyltransferase n=1 Tax=Paraliobacillus sp. PM-2 TaxID=1462524 RepID=UPI00061BD109|nr:RNA methyltransferase [Paraliobacillus sp. PM-2]CQR48083.1 Putative TrmH family tRNA/rRNA methyltransferase [Paraliobacillus sp. PM-2]